MNRLSGWIAALVLTSLPLNAQTSDMVADPAIEAAIERQIDAFSADDFEVAFEFASPMIRHIFGTPERFGAMVRSGYPMVHRAAKVEFLELRRIDGDLWQKILVRDGGGAYHTLDYQMQPDTDGTWRINGVQLLKAEQVGA
ncbi:DUF4864 domain-containing protein [Oceaniglobus indicus]|uniref:DUF4864 domain-containing protein n=1 Tax=Oceaniglobus indicus TaxID=2047749 RepID=UPI001F4E6D77|nr:DUF4864 domain-containing protein [Oceaniglobus indicus]